MKEMLFNKRISGQVIQGFSTRGGGVSPPPFSSLNLAFHVGDRPEFVRENRQRFFEALGLDLRRSTWGHQVHGNQVVVVDRAMAGAGALDLADALPGIDAMVTNLPGLSLGIMVADCLPILIYDPKHQAIGAVHAGWRGTLSKLAAKTIAVMGQQFGTHPADCQIAIGPGIGSCCFEVRSDVIVAFQRQLPQVFQDCLVYRNGTSFFDLYQANSLILQGIGVIGKNIFGDSTCCTSCEQNAFFSYRGAGGVTGRQAGVIGIME